MSDLKKYIKKRKKHDPEFARNYEEDFSNFKIGVLIRELRKSAGVTQEQLAKKLHTKKSAISRMENQSEDIRVSTLFKIAAALGKHVDIHFT